MTELQRQVAFFDLGGTLGPPRISYPEHRLESLQVYPHTFPVLQALKDSGTPCGIISNTGQETVESMEAVLKTAGIMHFFEPKLCVFSSVEGTDKSSEAIFKLAVARAGLGAAADQAVYVGEDRTERQIAMRAGLRVCPHPLLVEEVLQGHRLRYLKITVPAEDPGTKWRGYLKTLAVVPLHVEREAGRMAVYAISTASEATILDDLGFFVDRLGPEDAPLVTSLYLFRDDRQAKSGFLQPEGNSKACFGNRQEAEWVLSSTEQGLFVALPAGRRLDGFRFTSASHCRVAKLLPDTNLLDPFEAETGAPRASFLLAPREEIALDESIRSLLVEAITPEIITEHVERYTGARAIDPQNPLQKITSRHIFHPDNAVVCQTLAADMQKLGGGDLKVGLHAFAHHGRTLHNVEAELQGQVADEIVIISAHLDSTAENDDPYHPQTDPAPGADDDASGVAAILAIAKVFSEISRTTPPKRTIRFVLFNSEEDALAGSEAYSRDQASLDAQIVAVYQMDMISYNILDPRSFEVHAGYAPSADVQNRSLELARGIARVRPVLAPDLQPPQIYPDQTAGGHERDPADRRSDHGSFHRRGYSACVASEDFFAGPGPGAPDAEPNPHYHSRKDTSVDPIYTADIARVVAGAAWIAANA